MNLDTAKRRQMPERPSAELVAAPGSSVMVRAMEEDWRRAADAHLPVKHGSAHWRFNREMPQRLARQGWKLHISATIFSATDILLAAAPVLEEEDAFFKGVVSLAELKRLNCGLFYGYSQIGKFLTVYPADASAACRISQKLAEETQGLGGPAVPFEARVADGSPVFARYGLYQTDGPDDEAAMLCSPDGALEPDHRDRNPDWAIPPDGLFNSLKALPRGPLARSFRAYASLTQRGKGGVYRALDLSVSPARHCVLKEGRELGEMDVDGHDGRSRLAQEATVLADLASAGVPVPQIYARFEEGGHRYLVLEWIEGQNLANLLHPDQPQLSVPKALALSAASARLLASIHQHGWVWRDLKAANLLLCPDDALRPIDFEGAAPTGTTITSPWGSPGHLPEEWLSQDRATTAQDRYALGALIRQLFTNEIPMIGKAPALRSVRADVPEQVEQLMKRLLARSPRVRPSAQAAAKTLSNLSTLILSG